MSSNYADASDYWTACTSGGLVILAVLTVLIAMGAGYALGRRDANRATRSRRAQFRNVACASVDKALKEALIARDEMRAVTARKLVETVNHRFRPLLLLSEPLIGRLNAVDNALRGKVGVTVVAAPGPTPPAQPFAPVAISPPTAAPVPAAPATITLSGGSSATTPVGLGIAPTPPPPPPLPPPPPPIISMAPRPPAAEERASERDMTVPERDEAVHKALLAFEAFWKTIDAPTAIETTQSTLLGDRKAP